MPTYEFRCPDCGEIYNVDRPMSKIDGVTVTCHCGAEMKRLFSRVGIIFKGAGFYSTDKRGGSHAGNAKAESKAESPSASVKSQGN